MTPDYSTPTQPHEKLIVSLISEIRGLRSELDDLRKGLETAKIHLDPDALYNNKEIRLLLGVDERLIRKYRDNGQLAYSRVHDKYWYRGTDIINFLDRTYHDDMRVTSRGPWVTILESCLIVGKGVLH